MSQMESIILLPKCSCYKLQMLKPFISSLYDNAKEITSQTALTKLFICGYESATSYLNSNVKNVARNLGLMLGKDTEPNLAKSQIKHAKDALITQSLWIWLPTFM